MSKWAELADAIRPYVPAVPGAAWVFWTGDAKTALTWLGVYLLFLITVPAAIAVGQLLKHRVERLDAQLPRTRLPHSTKGEGQPSREPL